jgi:hypothetical protein
MDNFAHKTADKYNAKDLQEIHGDFRRTSIPRHLFKFLLDVDHASSEKNTQVFLFYFCPALDSPMCVPDFFSVLCIVPLHNSAGAE